MIALLYGLPLITLPQGSSSSFNKQWVINALQAAATSAGYQRWFIARDLAESVELYLQREWDVNSLSIRELEKIVRNLLSSLGYSTIAVHFSLPDPPISLSLLDLAHEAGEGYELLFFQLLGERLHRIAQSLAVQVDIYDLEPSLRQLLHRRRFQRNEVRKEIVSYIREYGSSKFSALRDNKKPLEITLS